MVRRYYRRGKEFPPGNSAGLNIKEIVMKPVSFLTLMIVVALLMTSCSMGAPEPTATPSPLPPTAPIPTDTLAPAPTDTLIPAPTDTPTIVPTATPSFPVVTPSDDPVNCRFGPSIDYAITGALKVGESTQVFGKTADASWWQVQNPTEPGQKCWMAASVTTGSGNFSGIGVVAAPTAFVTAVTLKLTPETITLTACSDPFDPIQIKGTIETNGPVTVKWHFETQQSGVSPDQTLEFTAFGPLDVSDEFMPSPVKAGTYWIRLIVTSPNSMTMEAQYKVVCS
jgi:SH3-like domain-containing protein